VKGGLWRSFSARQGALRLLHRRVLVVPMIEAVRLSRIRLELSVGTRRSVARAHLQGTTTTTGAVRLPMRRLPSDPARWWRALVDLPTTMTSA
jgi:hypothetical protein